MSYFLGIDGGGTKTKFLLADGTGKIAAQYKGPTCHYLQCGTEGVTRVLADGLDGCCALARISRRDITYIFAACAAYGDSESGDALILPAIRSAFGDIPFAAGNDSENALAGALAGMPGINVIAGTGSIGFGKNEEGRTARCGGWHHALGSDEGSGYWIACRLIAEYFRQSDGRDEKTALYDVISGRLGVADAAGVISKVVEQWHLDRTRVASLAPAAAELYDMGDPHAAEIFGCAAKELSDIVLALARTLGLGPGSKASCTGGVFNMGERILAPMRERLSAHGLVLVPPLLQPDRGSVILAMQKSGVEITRSVIAALGEDPLY